MVKYSVCMTHKNNARTLDASLNSILSQTSGDFEVIIVDAESNDGSLEVLRRYSREGRIKLIVKKCSRGKGRQIAFENSSGEYIITNMDLDDIYLPRLKELLHVYHSRCEGSALLSVYDETKSHRGFQNVTITSTKLAREIGGWHDLQYGEDWEFWARAAKAHAYAWLEFPFIESFNLHEERLMTLRKLNFRYIRYREAKRCGRPIFGENEHRTATQRIFELITTLMAPFYENYRDPFNASFYCYDESYKISGTGEQ